MWRCLHRFGSMLWHLWRNSCIPVGVRFPHQGMLAAGSAYHAAPLLLPVLASTAGEDACVLPYAAADALSALALAGLVHALRKQGLAPAFPGASDSMSAFTGNV